MDTHDDDLGADRRDKHDCSISFEEFLSMVEVLPHFFLGHLLQIKAPEKRRMILNIPKNKTLEWKEEDSKKIQSSDEHERRRTQCREILLEI